MNPCQVAGIGNAIVDALASVDDGFLARMKIQKGVMQLIDARRAEELYAAMRAPHRAPGGSVANTIAGLGALGLTTAFIGRVNDDEAGRFYAQSMAAGGTEFVNPPVAGGAHPTSRSLIFVSPDGERSMNTHLGISTEFGPDDVPEALGAQAEILFLEGYLYDHEANRRAFGKAARLVQAGGGKVGLSLSDPFCVERHREGFRRLVRSLDFVIGNRREWMSLYQWDLEGALAQAARECPLVICTRSDEDVIILEGERRIAVHVEPVTPVDATGAGDQFAAGFLYGLATGQDLERAGRMGCLAASEIIGHFGARPERDVKALFRAEGLI